VRPPGQWYGQLLGDDDDRTNGSAGPFTQITSSYAHNCGLTTDGNIDCWGVDTTVGHIVVVVSNVRRQCTTSDRPKVLLTFDERRLCANQEVIVQ